MYHAFRSVILKTSKS